MLQANDWALIAKKPLKIVLEGMWRSIYCWMSEMACILRNKKVYMPIVKWKDRTWQDTSLDFLTNTENDFLCLETLIRDFGRWNSLPKSNTWLDSKSGTLRFDKCSTLPCRSSFKVPTFFLVGQNLRCWPTILIKELYYLNISLYPVWAWTAMKAWAWDLPFISFKLVLIC